MSDPTFAQPERRSLILPIVIVLALIGAAVAAALHFVQTPTATITHLHTSLLPTTTVFKSNSIVVGTAHTESQIFVATTLRIDNHLHVPIYLDDFTCTFTDQAGAIMTATASQKSDLPNLELTFPALKPLLQTPLLRETRIDPAKSLEGTILLSFPFTEAQWKARKSATIEIALYHQDPLTLEIPKP